MTLLVRAEPSGERIQMSNTFIGGIRLPYMNPAPDIPSEPISPAQIRLTVPEGFRLVVGAGAQVSVGETLAVSENGLPDLLSGISGTVTLSDSPAVVTVLNDGRNTPSAACAPLEKGIDLYDGEELREALLKRGLALPPAENKSPLCLIVDCCEHDSFSSAAARLIFEKTEAVLGGIRILLKLFGVGKAICAVPKPMYECANALCAQLGSGGMIRTKLVSGKYPQHEPHMLISALFNIELNPAVTPGRVGYPTVTAETCAAVYEALAFGIPYTAAYITVSEQTLVSKNYYVPFGTALSELVSAFGWPEGEEHGLRVGGGMTGRSADGSFRTAPDTFAVVLTAEKKKSVPRACISCGRCRAVCPVRLLPSLIAEYAAEENHRLAGALHAETCIGCGCCNAVCPAGIDLKAGVWSEKLRLLEEGASHE